MKNHKKVPVATYLKVIGLHVEKYNLMMTILASIVTLIGIVLCVYWQFDETSSGPLSDNLYLASYIIFTVLSFSMVIALILNRFKKAKTFSVAIYIHIYTFLLIAWATLVCILDLDLGISPFIYLIVACIVAGLFVVEPFFFTLLILGSFSTIMAFELINQFTFFDNDYKYENIFNMFFFIVIIIAISFRHFRVTIREFNYQQRLLELTYQDELTGLLNERSYVNAVDEINNAIKENKDVNFALIIMDVNNLKATNDQYGHRYGCHLVVHTGQVLPTLFESSKLFHIGGDEFIAMVFDKDLENFEKKLEEFDKTMEYSLINYDGVDLIFSVARGYAKYNMGDRYQDVLQRADEMMYTNKKNIKEKYNLKGR